MNSKTFEIERKFLLKKLPELKYEKVIEVEQYYIDTNESGLTKRVRSSKLNGEVKYYYTEKKFIQTDSTSTNEEIEYEITEEKFEELKKESNSYITKKRHVISDGQRNWEIDLFTNIYLIMAEVEFLATEDNMDKVSKEVKNYQVPNFIAENLIKEVSESKKFSNKRLAIAYHP